MAGARRRGGSIGERVLRVVADVRPGEGVTVALLALHVFVLLLAYYLVKTAREPLILATGGAELKAYTAAAQVLLLVPFAKAYDLLSRRFGRHRLIPIVTLFFASHLPVFFLLAEAGVPNLGFAFYVWVGVFSLMIVAQFWSFANDLYAEDQGQRLFPLIAAGSAAGAVAGAYGAALLPVGPYTVMLITAGLLVVSLALTLLVHRRETMSARKVALPPEAPRPPSLHEAPIGGTADAFGLVVRDRYLLLVAGLTLVRNWVNTTGEYVLDRMLVETAAERLASGAITDVGAYIQGFKGTFYGTVNLVELLLQFLVVSRIMRHLGVRAALFVLPLLALGGYVAMAAATTLIVVAVAKAAENSLDYSLQNTAQHALFLRPTREAKYKAKAVIDTCVWRGGDVLAAGVIFAGNTWLGFGTRDFILVNVGMLLAWIGVVVLLARQHARAMPRRAPASPTLASAPGLLAPAAAFASSSGTLLAPAD